MSSGGIYPKPKPFSYHDNAEEEEGLLSGTSEHSERQPWSRKKVVGVAAFFILLLISGAFIRTLLRGPIVHPNSMWYTGSDTQTNGTHEFKRTVVIVSIDGLRADYLDRGLTPHLLSISKNGLRAKSMRPIFPTLTFPNHWALMTGLYAESHGIVANNFWDPASKTEFWYNRIESCWKSEWWFGEPMWETAGKAGLITANLMWPGPPKTTSGASSTYFVPWEDHVPLKNKHDQIMKWIDLPLRERPQLIMAYEPSLDQAGHKTGPMSALVNKTLGAVDAFAKDLQESLKSRNLTDIVDIVFVSDHGMTDTSDPELIYMDDIIGEDGLKAIEHEDGWPAMGLRFLPTANVTHYLNLLLKASDENPEKFDVYTHDTMPERYHFSHHERIAPIYIIPKIGYVLTTKAEGNVGMSKGNHGYDNEATPMQAMFIAHGPFTTDVKASVKGQQKDKLNTNWHSTSNDAFIMDRFQNVEIYNLIMKLLGIEAYAANNNGTVGFWDKYL
ncbi:Phosphodiest-domain-containing protein [Collybia nuda]|uniref:Phosphodiest-domain-containing protein n=1 Tax=Collybia nuda TaxID=64659 RepID=A0A9P5YAI2_9AGAR|nr:Phosphodiest-domain-containing protein [Collybia nuda]